MKTLPGIEEITKGTGTHKHTETESRYFDWHGRLPQSKESKCLWTHDKDGQKVSQPAQIANTLNTNSVNGADPCQQPEIRNQ